ncbi:MAG: hypothetical protein IPK24_00310 [Kineosporiaceae bacterium]|nr:hypothetical protein [Kineosporiaceae bacterium]MBK8074016.1 hypothetical protein [Kineosporiaceae bacterium]
MEPGTTAIIDFRSPAASPAGAPAASSTSATPPTRASSRPAPPGPPSSRRAARTAAAGAVGELDLDAPVTRAGRRTQRDTRAAGRRSRRMRLAAVATVGVLTVSGAVVVALTQRTSERDLQTALAQTPQASVSSSVPPLSLIGGATPSVSAGVSGTPSPTASPGARTSGKPTAKATGTKSAAKPAGRSGVVLDGRRMGGWYAGAGGVGVADGSFAAWQGEPLSIVGTWADGSDEEQRTVSGLTANYSGWKGAIDIAVGGTVLGSGENYSAAADGAYDARWRQAAQTIASVRKGASGPTFLRPFHEFNGTWFPEWSVNSGNVGDFKAAFRRYAGILREALPEAYIVWCPNSGDHSGVPVDTYYPGDDVVDVIAPDYYHDGYSEDPSSTSWRGGSPLGIEAWRQYAAKHGKPMGLPEWGLKPDGGGDSPEWITAVHTWSAQHANTATWQIGAKIPAAAAGKMLYMAYFNVVFGGDPAYTIHGYGANPRSEAVYQSLTWGNIRG